MKQPKGTLTAAQREILEVVWDRGEDLPSGAEVWKELSRDRKVARTTVITLLNRLVKRGWLKRKKIDGTMRYESVLDEEAVSKRIAEQFVDDFFEGSAANLVMSLLGGEGKYTDANRRLDKAIRKAEKRK